MAGVESESDDDFHSLCSRPSQLLDDDALSATMEPPVHPVPCMQGPFEESIHESADQYELSVLDDAPSAGDRRRMLLEADFYDESWAARWKQRPEAQHHPLIKLIAQIVFGLHLLQQEQAKSDEEVVKILQTHVNDVDTFLEHTAEDLDLAIEDIKDRICHMRLPMAEQHIVVFDEMLRDKKFRRNLLSGNSKIESIVTRTERATNAAMFDVSRGSESVKELSSYLHKVRHRYPAGRKDIADVFDAMRGNERGWAKYLVALKAKNDTLSREILALRTIMGEIADLVIEASRRDRPSSSKVSQSLPCGTIHKSASAPSGVRSRFSRNGPTSPAKDKSSPGSLPKTPIVKPHPVPFAARYEQPRQGPPVPSGGRSPVSPIAPESPPRTRLRPSLEQGIRHRRRDSADKANSTGSPSKHSSPLGSHPPESTGRNRRVREKKLNRSQSQGTHEILQAASAKPPTHALSFSVNQIQPVTRTRVQTGGDSRLPHSQHQDHSLSNDVPRIARTDQEEQTWTNGSALARRISKRLKNARIPAHENPFTDNYQPDSRPIDSAHSAEAERRLDFNGVPYPDVRSRKASYPFPTTFTDFDPNNTDFGAPLNAMPPSVIAQINGITTKNNRPVVKPRVGRNMSIRKFFHRGMTP